MDVFSPEAAGIRTVGSNGAGLRNGTEDSMRLKQWRWVIAMPAVVLVVGLTSGLASASSAAPAAKRGAALDCGSVAHSANCVDIYNPEATGEGNYVGHDEP